MASSETIRRMTHLSNLLETQDMGPSIRIIDLIFTFPHRGADYLWREIGIGLQLVAQGRVLTGGFDAAGLRAGFEGVGVDMSIIMGIVMGLGL